MGNTFTTQREVEVAYIKPSGKAFSELPKENLTATVEGTGWDLMSDFLFNDRMQLSVDLRNERAAVIDPSDLLSRNTDLSLKKKGLSIIRTNPANLYISYKDETQKTVPLLLNDGIEYAAGFFPTSPPLLEPDSVLLAGAPGLLDTIDFWRTEPLTATNQKDSVRVRLQLEEKLPKLIRLSVQETEVLIPVEKWTEKNIMIPVEVQNARDTLLKLIPPAIETTFSVPLSRFNEVTAASFRLTIDLQGLNPNAKNNSVPVMLQQKPDFIRALTLDPKSVRYFVSDTVRTD